MRRNEIDALRLEIDEIDLKMKELFLKRMDYVKLVGKYKSENNIPLVDLKREESIKKNSNDISDEDMKKAYLKFLSSLIDISKDYQKNHFNINNN